MSVLTEPSNSRRNGLSSGVVKRFEKQIKNESVPVLEKLVTWTNLLSFVAESEELLLDDEKNVELRASHRELTETSIVLGESLLKEEGIDHAFQQLSCKREDFKAKIRMLRYKDRMWHGDLDSEKSEQVLKALFGALP
jgi:hypothetical protein